MCKEQRQTECTRREEPVKTTKEKETMEALEIPNQESKVKEQMCLMEY